MALHTPILIAYFDFNAILAAKFVFHFLKGYSSITHPSHDLFSLQNGE